MSTALSWIKLIKCPVCGKEFIFNSMTVYKLPSNAGMIQYCSYPCFRKEQKKRERKLRNPDALYSRYKDLEKDID